MADKLKVLIPEKNFETSGGKVVLAPFKFKQFPQALKLVERYSQIIFGDKEEVIEGETIRVAKGSADIVAEIFARSDDNYEVLADVAEMLALVSGGTLTKLDDLGYDEVISLMVEVFEMNLDFFNRIGDRLNRQKAEEVSSTKKPVKTGTPE